MRAIALLVSATTLEPGTISIAHPSRVTMKNLLRTCAAQENQRCRFVPVPWQPVYWLLGGGELMRLHLPFRAARAAGPDPHRARSRRRRPANPARRHLACASSEPRIRQHGPEDTDAHPAAGRVLPAGHRRRGTARLQSGETLAGRGHEVAVATQRMAGVPDQEILASGSGCPGRTAGAPTGVLDRPTVPITHPCRSADDRQLARIIGRSSLMLFSTNSIRQQCRCASRSNAGRSRFGLVPNAARLQSCLRDQEIDADGLGM